MAWRGVRSTGRLMHRGKAVCSAPADLRERRVRRTLRRCRQLVAPGLPSRAVLEQGGLFRRRPRAPSRRPGSGAAEGCLAPRPPPPPTAFISPQGSASKARPAPPTWTPFPLARCDAFTFPFPPSAALRCSGAMQRSAAARPFVPGTGSCSFSAASAHLSPFAAVELTRS
jgi:hypothetical protein